MTPVRSGVIEFEKDSNEIGKVSHSNLLIIKAATHAFTV